jgi:hypothetical protein
VRNQRGQVAAGGDAARPSRGRAAAGSAAGRGRARGRSASAPRAARGGHRRTAPSVAPRAQGPLSSGGGTDAPRRTKWRCASVVCVVGARRSRTGARQAGERTLMGAGAPALVEALESDGDGAGTRSLGTITTARPRRRPARRLRTRPTVNAGAAGACPLIATCACGEHDALRQVAVDVVGDPACELLEVACARRDLDARNA